MYGISEEEWEVITWNVRSATAFKIDPAMARPAAKAALQSYFSYRKSKANCTTMARYIPANMQEEKLGHDILKGDDNPTIYMTNGVFDIFHAGHLHFLRYIGNMKLGHDILVVGINIDSAVTSMKGVGRPVLPFGTRVEAVSVVPWVDYVTPIELNACPLIEIVRPHVYVKGDDWRDRHMGEAELVERHNGAVMYAPFQHGLSTTGIIEAVLNKQFGI